MRLARREALWAIKALRDEPLPLFAAASFAINEEGRRTEPRADEGRPAGPEGFGVKSDSHTEV
jgi:error-prone DNA polymerase